MSHLSSVALPNRENAAHAAFRQISFTPRAQIFQEQIAKANGLHTSGFIAVHHSTHNFFVNIVRAPSRFPGRKINFLKRNSDGARLFFQKRFADAVMTNPPILFGHGRH